LESFEALHGRKADLGTHRESVHGQRNRHEGERY
jgi:hypothetical protein